MSLICHQPCSQPSPRRARDRQGEQGQSLVEFSLVLPILLLVLLSIFEFGNVFFDQIRVQNAVRDGSRYAALNGCPGNASVQTLVQQQAGGLSIVTTTTYSPVNCDPANPATCAGQTDPLPEVTVAGSYTYVPITPLGSFVAALFGGSASVPQLTSSSTVHNEC